MGWRLKPGYRENLSRNTWEGEANGSYWHSARAALSGDYQFDVYLTARELALAMNAQSVLDVGSGPGTKAARLLCDVIADVVLVDQPTTAGLAAQRCPAATFVAADLEAPAIDIGRAFDVIICADVIEHLLDPGPCLRFIRRQATPGTRIVISTPERDYARGLDCIACEKPEHVREWNGNEFAATLHDHGFAVVRHWLCPTIRPEPGRGDMRRPWREPFAPRLHGPTGNEPDRLRSCQFMECRVAPSAHAA